MIMTLLTLLVRSMGKMPFCSFQCVFLGHITGSIYILDIIGVFHGMAPMARAIAKLVLNDLKGKR